MSTPKDFDTLKRKVYLAYHQDGILDVVVATVLLGFGTFMATKNVVFLTTGVIFATLYTLMKQRITIPRFGYVRFVPQEKAMLQSFILLGIGVLVLLAVFVGNTFLKGSTSAEMQELVQRYHMVPLSALLFALPSLIAAALLGLKRFYLYALLLVGLPALGAWLNVETFIPILTAGAIVLVYGFVLMASFVKRYPANGEAGSDVSG